MQENFINKFIEEELYLQNPPLRMDKFIDFCGKRGIYTNENELELFEKEGLFYPIIRVENPRNSIGRRSYITLTFEDFEKDLLKSLLQENKIIDPSISEFIPYSNFKEKGHINEKISNLYSSFQIDWLKRIKDTYNFNSEKTDLKNQQKYYNKLTEFYLLIQIYAPFGKSNTRTISLNTDENWYDKIENFNLQEVLDYLNLDMDFVSIRYWDLSRKIKEFLGDGDWVQLWKSIRWNKKDKLEGSIRLGIEYLQWALMLKRCIEDFQEKEIFDVDEAGDYPPKDVLKIDPTKENRRTVRGVRNRDFINKKTGEYEFHNGYKRLFYLANSFDLNYHPRLIIFVEGKTEKEILPKFFEFAINKPENLGIDIIDIGGISKFFGQKISVPNENKKYDKLVISNFKNLIDYTLNKWQVLPFFIGDNENDIVNLLKEGNLFDFKDEKRPMPEDWYFIWKNDFEFDNFTDQELLVAIKEVLSIEIDIKIIEKARKESKGIKIIDPRISDPKIKIEISNLLFENLKNLYLESKDEKLVDRPVFDALDKILDITLTNHPPVHTSIENKNKDTISDIIRNNNKI